MPRSDPQPRALRWTPQELFAAETMRERFALLGDDRVSLSQTKIARMAIGLSLVAAFEAKKRYDSDARTR